ncbi:glycosyltransferase [Blastococcus sp. Marseille-P5729]|uniref:glycosyltransferase n=1 Tax=Blastococcus sp. Marseille-P5729 TaxID=2086582 RepID=UPI00131BBF24|nr:glycosyltransferase [Blastococcus sp. Marseille-P5729]
MGALSLAKAVIIYEPSFFGSLLAPVAVLLRRRLVCVVVGDPMAALAEDVIPGLRGKAIRTVVTAAMTWALKRASVVRYVTSSYLQTRYPSPDYVRQFAITDGISRRGRAVLTPTAGRRLKVLTVGSLDRPYKGVADLIVALEATSEVTGVEIELRVAGSGRLADDLLETSGAGIEVVALGQLDETELTDAYLDADLFVLASWAEGMPRALIEAMSVGLPCVATSVGGVPEVLPSHAIARPRNTPELVAVLSVFVADLDFRRREGARNWGVAHDLLQSARSEEKAFAAEVVK